MAESNEVVLLNYLREEPLRADVVLALLLNNKGIHAAVSSAHRDTLQQHHILYDEANLEGGIYSLITQRKTTIFGSDKTNRKQRLENIVKTAMSGNAPVDETAARAYTLFAGKLELVIEDSMQIAGEAYSALMTSLGEETKLMPPQRATGLLSKYELDISVYTQIFDNLKDWVGERIDREVKSIFGFIHRSSLKQTLRKGINSALELFELRYSNGQSVPLPKPRTQRVFPSEHPYSLTEIALETRGEEKATVPQAKYDQVVADLKAQQEEDRRLEERLAQLSAQPTPATALVAGDAVTRAEYDKLMAAFIAIDGAWLESKRKLDEANRQNQQYNDALTAAQEQYRELEGRVPHEKFESVVDALNKRKEEILRIEQEKTTLQTRLGDLEARLSAQPTPAAAPVTGDVVPKKMYDELTALFTEQNTTLGSLGEERTALEREIAAKAALIEDLQGQLASQTTENGWSAVDADALKEKNSGLEKKVTEFRETLAAQQAAMNAVTAENARLQRLEQLVSVRYKPRTLVKDGEVFTPDQDILDYVSGISTDLSNELMTNVVTHSRRLQARFVSIINKNVYPIIEMGQDGTVIKTTPQTLSPEELGRIYNRILDYIKRYGSVNDLNLGFGAEAKRKVNFEHVESRIGEVLQGIMLDVILETYYMITANLVQTPKRTVAVKLAEAYFNSGLDTEDVFGVFDIIEQRIEMYDITVQDKTALEARLNTMHMLGENIRVARKVVMEKYMQLMLQSVEDGHKAEVIALGQTHGEELKASAQWHAAELENAAQRHAGEMNGLELNYQRRIDELTQQNIRANNTFLALVELMRDQGFEIAVYDGENRLDSDSATDGFKRVVGLDREHQSTYDEINLASGGKVAAARDITLQELVRKFPSALCGASNINDIVSVLSANLTKIVPADFFALALYRENSPEADIAVSVLDNEKFPMSMLSSDFPTVNRGAVSLLKTEWTVTPYGADLEEKGIQELGVVPLYNIGGQQFGSLMVGSKEDGKLKESLDTLTDIARYMSGQLAQITGRVPEGYTAAQVEEIEKKAQQLSTANTALEVENRELEKRVDELNSANDNLERTLRALEKDYIRSDADVTALRELYNFMMEFSSTPMYERDEGGKVTKRNRFAAIRLENMTKEQAAKHVTHEIEAGMVAHDYDPQGRHRFRMTYQVGGVKRTLEMVHLPAPKPRELPNDLSHRIAYLLTGKLNQ